MQLIDVSLKGKSLKVKKSEGPKVRREVSPPPVSPQHSVLFSYALALDGVRKDEANPILERQKISHLEGSKLYQRGPFR